MSKPTKGPFADDPIAEILADVPNGGMEDRSLARDYLLELAARVEKVLAECIHERDNGLPARASMAGRVVRILNGEEP